MAKRPPFPPYGPKEGIRRKAQGNDPNFGSHNESRLRGTNPLLPPGAENVRLSDEQTKEYPLPDPRFNEIADQVWRYFLPPQEIRWIYTQRVGLLRVPTASIAGIPLYQVNRAEVLVILEWTPILLISDTARPGLMQPVSYDRDAWLTSLGAEFTVSGAANVQAVSSVVTGEDISPTNPPMFRAIAGTTRFNEVGFIASPHHPFTLYADEGAVISTIIQAGGMVNGTASAANGSVTFNNLPGATDWDTTDGGWVMGGRLFGFVTNRLAFNRIKGRINLGGLQ